MCFDHRLVLCYYFSIQMRVEKKNKLAGIKKKVSASDMFVTVVLLKISGRLQKYLDE